MSKMHDSTISNISDNLKLNTANGTQQNSDSSDNNGASILETMELITSKAKDSCLSEEFFENVRPLSERLGKMLGLTHKQAVLYSIFVDNYDNQHIGLKNIKSHTRATMIRIAQLQDEIDAIENKRFIRRSIGSKSMDAVGLSYNVPYESLKALRANKPYVPKPLANLSFSQFQEELDKFIDMRSKMDEPYELFIMDLKELIDGNMHLKICKELKKIQEDLELFEYEWVMLAALCSIEPYFTGTMDVSTLGKLFSESYANSFHMAMNYDFLRMLNFGLVEYGCCDGAVDKNCLGLTRRAKRLLLSESKEEKTAADDISLTDCRKIATKSLFYESDVKEQVDRLNGLLSKKTFGHICKRLKENGMRRGFTCLFYGAAGTGKTETVLQLAKATGRKIMQVDIADIKDKYVGESEKNVKAIFEDYRSALATEKAAPILLFNEADAIICKRFENVEHSVDNMYNAMQNIILQEMENFEGILIATTNLAGNMDSAFERRFLYKVRFEKPSADVRRQIWQSIIPTVSDDTASVLAKEFEFSGGQIDNIARKFVVDNILYGESGDMYTKLRQFCREETIQNRNIRQSIGFVA